MTTPATSTVSPKKESGVSINANGTEYKIESILFNKRGESRFIGSNCFEGLTFESVQKAAEFMLNLYFEDILIKIAA